MEKFNFGENSNESICEEIVRSTRIFVEDSKKVLSSDVLNVNLVDKLLEATDSYKNALHQITPKSDEENLQITSALQDLIDLENLCNQRKTLH